MAESETTPTVDQAETTVVRRRPGGAGHGPYRNKAPSRGGARPNTGGKRPGAGGVPKRVTYRELYERTEAELHALLPEVPRALKELVVGIWTEEGDGEKRRIYRQPPSVKAIELLFNRTFGLQPQRYEVDVLVREEARRIAEEAGLDADAIVSEVYSLLGLSG